MITLSSELRKELEKCVKRARRAAESGAQQALEQVGVGERDAPTHLTAERRSWRNRLRAHGRQLGDRRDEKSGAQTIDHLIQECAYEHWHRMLFARFLAENSLLIEPRFGVAITLAEVQELAREQSTDWLLLASDYAEQMLPQIFRKGDPVLDIALPPETRSELEDMLKGLPRTVFLADDSLGWVYQFWQADRKDEINESGVKVGADELPAVTQLFTEDYMVLFLLHNTLGAWWSAKVLMARPELALSAKSESELREACRIGEINWTYLRFSRDVDDSGAVGPWRPAAGAFDGWPRVAKHITMLDPCMGSGHFLVFALPIIVAFRMIEEKLSQNDAVDAALRDNLFGLEIDPRCTQIAAFNLALSAWRMTGYRTLPRLNLACSGAAIGVTRAEWRLLADRTIQLADLAASPAGKPTAEEVDAQGIAGVIASGLERLYDLFTKAPSLGSLIDPHRADADLFHADFSQLEPLLGSMLNAASGSDFVEMAVAAQGMTRAAELLNRSFTLVATNVPYLGRRRQDEVIRSYCSEFYQDAAAELATCFIERCVGFLDDSGTAALVSSQNWLFLTTYTAFRSRMLREVRWDIMARLGRKSFQSPMWEFNVTLLCISAERPTSETYLAAFDASDADAAEKKATVLQTVPAAKINQLQQLDNPDARLAFKSTSSLDSLDRFAESYQGMTSGDNSRFFQYFWEQQALQSQWREIQHASCDGPWSSGREQIIRWEEGKGELVRVLGEGVKGRPIWGRLGIAIGQMVNLPAAPYIGTPYDMSCAVIVPKDDRHLAPIYCFCSSPEFLQEVRRIDQKLNVTNATLVKVPFDLSHWQQVAAEKYPSGLPRPDSNAETQWLFSGNPKVAESPLQVSVARLLGYRWPRQTGSSFPGCASVDRDDLEDSADEDGIVCLAALKGRFPADERLKMLLRAAFGEEWSASRLATLLAKVGFDGKTLDDWLRDGFFRQHCDLFQQRPFVWHVWDGLRDGFHAFVNYHQLAAPNGGGMRTLEKLMYSYLGDWIDRQRADQKGGLEGADGRLVAALHLRTKLEKIATGSPPYDIFVRWKPLNAQPIGWDPDINDGVRVNIRPFMAARPLGARGANACILRTTPKIKWDKDRGREPHREKADYPWFWGWDQATSDFAGGSAFDGNRWNDLHYSLVMKQGARDPHAVTGGQKP